MRFETLKRALELDPSNFSAAYNLGAAYVQKQMMTEARPHFVPRSTIAPDYAPGHRALGEVLLYQGQVDDALTELRRAVELAPQDPGNHAALAKALSAKGLTPRPRKKCARRNRGGRSNSHPWPEFHLKHILQLLTFCF